MEILKEKLPKRNKYTVVCPESADSAFVVRLQVSHVLAATPESAVDLIREATGGHPNLVLEGHALPVWPKVNEVKT